MSCELSRHMPDLATCSVIFAWLFWHRRTPIWPSRGFQAFQLGLLVQELAHKKAAELAAEARARKQAQPPSDDRPLEDLLSFIGTEPAR